MGIGFICTITGVILAVNGWTYAYLFPYSHPMLALKALQQAKGKTGPMPQIIVEMLTKDTWISIGVALVVFVAGYFIVLKKSVK